MELDLEKHIHSVSSCCQSQSLATNIPSLFYCASLSWLLGCSAYYRATTFSQGTYCGHTSRFRNKSAIVSPQAREKGKDGKGINAGAVGLGKYHVSSDVCRTAGRQNESVANCQHEPGVTLLHILEQGFWKEPLRIWFSSL